VDTLLQVALSQMDAGLIVADVQGRITFANEAAARLHGVERLDHRSADAIAYATVDGAPCAAADLPLARAALHGEVVADACWRIHRPDGADVTVVGSARPATGDDGERLGAVLTLREDPGRAAASTGQRERDALIERLRAAFAHVPVAMLSFDAAGRPMTANAAFERLWDAALPDFPPDYSIFSDAQLDAAGLLPLVQRAFAGEVVALPALCYDMARVAGRGRACWTDAHLYPVRGPSGSVECVVLTHTDASDRVEAEAARLRAAARAERLQALTAALSVAATPDEVAAAVLEHAASVFGAVGIVIARLSDDGSQLALMRAGRMPDDIRDDWQQFPLEAPVPLADAARRGEPIFLESREAWRARYPAMLPLLDATGHHANAVAPLIVRGHVLGVLGAAFDAPRAFDEQDRALALTVAQQCAQALERARLFEAERSARADAEAANRAKGEFLAAMSHELRTPLNAIAGYVQLLDMGLHGPVTESQRAALGRIELAQRHLLRHVNDVLNFARLQAGRLEYTLAPVALAEVLAELEPLIGPQLRTKALTYTVDVPGDCVVRADREKLMQVLLNLLSNAAKFTPAGGRVTVDWARRGDGTDSRATVFLRVTDTGVGIPRDKYDAVFEPFVQVDATPAGRTGGSGLGLAISRELARGMGGDLRVRSIVGMGTAFTIALPRAQTA
jgi:signal transduction histidine kinase/PAS domain-containing protein